MTKNSTLYIVGCTRTKVWDSLEGALLVDYIPATHVYEGRGFLKALPWVIGKPWVILSGKYGFIEPEHPIGRYDIRLGNRHDHSISIATLYAQVQQVRIWRISGELTEVILADFPRVECLNCNKTYLDIVRRCFPENKIFMRSVK